MAAVLLLACAGTARVWRRGVWVMITGGSGLYENADGGHDLTAAAGGCGGARGVGCVRGGGGG